MKKQPKDIGNWLKISPEAWIKYIEQVWHSPQQVREFKALELVINEGKILLTKRDCKLQDLPSDAVLGEPQDSDGKGAEVENKPWWVLGYFDGVWRYWKWLPRIFWTKTREDAMSDIARNSQINEELSLKRIRAELAAIASDRSSDFIIGKEGDKIQRCAINPRSSHAMSALHYLDVALKLQAGETRALYWAFHAGIHAGGINSEPFRLMANMGRATVEGRKSPQSESIKLDAEIHDFRNSHGNWPTINELEKRLERKGKLKLVGEFEKRTGDLPCLLFGKQLSLQAFRQRARLRIKKLARP